MKTISNRLTQFTLCCALAFASMSLPLQAQKGKPGGGGGGGTTYPYTITQLATPPGTTDPVGRGLNNLGQIVGYSHGKAIKGAIPSVGVLWQGQTTHLLPALPGQTSSRANALSDSGLVVGSSGGPLQAVWWEFTASGPVVRSFDALLPMSDLTLLEAVDVSNDGQYVLFRASSPANASNYWTVIARVESAGSVITGGNVIATLENAWPSALNFNPDTGTLRSVGALISPVDGNRYQAWLWENDALILPEGLDLNPPAPHQSQGSGVNQQGDVVGGRNGEAVVWRATSQVEVIVAGTGVMTRLPSINEAGLVVGGTAEIGAYLWHPDLGLSSLNALTGASIPLFTGLAVNRDGHILAYGHDKSGKIIPFVLTPSGQ